MNRESFHVSDQELLLAADGELPAGRMQEVHSHLTACWTCRARMRELEGVIADFIQTRESTAPDLPAADGPRALLKLRMAELRKRSAGPFSHGRGFVFAAGVAIILLAGVILLHNSRTMRVEARATPDPYLTPGATLPVTRDDVCGAGTVESVRIVPASVALKVFASYGINHPQPRAYEVDYLVSPALGGADSIRNFWPQPYHNTVWSAHVKDALEDHLREMVCAGRLDLETAQRDIARDWIAAYKKYFHADTPLIQHASFLKDRPWE